MRQLLTFIWHHPISSRNRLGALVRLLWWQVISRLKTDVQVGYGVSSLLVARKGMSGATGNIYCGLHEFEEMAFFLQLARPGDLFIDVGANVGSYSVLVPKETGCDSISFEPVPDTFEVLKKNMAINALNGARHAMFNAGVGEKRSVLRFTADRDTTNRVMHSAESGGLEVQVVSLDETVPEHRTCWMKVDVEGFEMGVIQGAARVLSEVKGLVIELNGAGERFGHTDESIRQKLTDSGFQEMNYSPFDKTIKPGLAKGDNAFFVRKDEVACVQSRLASAPQYRVRGVAF